MQIAKVMIKLLDKGKPFERAGRKVVGLSSHLNKEYVCKVAGRISTLRSADSATG